MSQRKVIPISAAAPAHAADDGWRRLSTLSEPRLTEMAQNYRALGYEVQIREVQKTQDGGCTSCFDEGESLGRVYGTLYVRRARAGSADEELFD